MRRLLLPLLSTVLAAVLGTVLTAAPAWAHTRLVSSTPSQGEPVEAPTEVVLVFSDRVQPGLSALSVTGADGQEHVTGSPSAAGDGASVSQALRAPLPPGTYRVAYRVLAADGHTVTGSYEVTAVAPPGTSAAAAPTRAATAPTPGTTTGALTPTAGGDAGDGGLPLLPLVVGGLAVAGTGGLLARRLGGAPPQA